MALRRAGLVESVHRGRYAFCAPDGRVLKGVGDVEATFYPRSALKPFQAMPLVLSGAADAFGMTDRELAIACASHHGEDRHVAAVRSLLDKAGLTEDDLDNGAHPPISVAAADELIRGGLPPRKIHGNCSGKHAGMVAVCKHMGWGISGYRRPDHPLQVWSREVISVVCGVPDGEIGVGVDGCGAPAFALPLRGLATGFARLGTGRDLPDDLASAALRLGAAIREHPFLVSGTSGFDTEVMENSDLVVKGGADGVWAAGSEDGWGFALKITDGASRAVRPASVAAIRSHGAEIGVRGRSEARNLHGERSGVLGAV